jgi:hypothetical protein
MDVNDKYRFDLVDRNNEQLINEFLLRDSDIKYEIFNVTKMLKVYFEGQNWFEKLDALHTYFTESAPYIYYGTSFSIVKNYSSGKKYSSQGEEDLGTSNQKLLKFILSDNTFISIKQNKEEQCLKILISVNGKDEASLLSNTLEVEKILIEFIMNFK